MYKNLCLFIFFISLIATTFITQSVYGKNTGLKLIRDSEIERTIRNYAAPLLKAAGIPESSVGIHIVNNDKINAFVFNGLNIYINSGLIIKSNGIGELTGVLAHEIGHLEGAHLVRSRDAINNLENELLLSRILAILTGTVASDSTTAKDASTAIIIGGSSSAKKRFFRYTQAQEQAADQAALRYLDMTKQSAYGFMDLLRRLEKQELLSSERRDPYSSSHPETSSRIILVSNHLSKSLFTEKKYSKESELLYKRMVFKLRAFISDPEKVIDSLHSSSDSFASRYAQIIALYRMDDSINAINKLDKLINEFPSDPWLYELKGQILFETGNIDESISPYEKSVQLAPKEFLIRLALARAIIESDNALILPDAISHLKIATLLEPDYAPIWHFLGVANGRIENYSSSHLAFAEASFLRGQKKRALHHAKLAIELLTPDSPEINRANDIIMTLEESH